MNLIIKLIIKPLQSLLKLLFNRIFYVALALIVQLAWLLIALFRLMEYSRWLTIGMQAAGFLVVLWIVNKKINPSYKLAWTMLILVFPVFGVSLYLLFGKSRIGTVMEQHKSEESGCCPEYQWNRGSPWSLRTYQKYCQILYYRWNSGSGSAYG